MRIFNTGSDFWRSEIGKQLRLIKAIYPQYANSSIKVQKFAEQISRSILPECKRLELWPKLDIRQKFLVFEWAERGELNLALDGKELIYVSYSIGKLGTFSLDLTSPNTTSVAEIFIQDCLWD